MLAQVKLWEREQSTASQSEVHQLSEAIKASEARLEKLVAVYLDGDIEKTIYLKKKDELMRASLANKEKLKAVERGRNNWVEPLRNWILDTKQADFLSHSDNLYEIKAFVQKIGTNPMVRDKSARFSPPAAFGFTASHRARLQSRPAAAHGSAALSDSEVSVCGEGEIRTPETLASLPPFQGGPFDRSGTSPRVQHPNIIDQK